MNIGKRNLRVEILDANLNRLFLIWLFVFVSGCTSVAESVERPRAELIGWSGYYGDPRTVEDVVYYLNRREVGVGADAFDTILDHLNVIPDGSIILYEYMPWRTTSPSPLGGLFPFSNDRSLRIRFNEIVKRKGFFVYVVDSRSLKDY